jgi:hypothetical protein
MSTTSSAGGWPNISRRNVIRLAVFVVAAAVLTVILALTLPSSPAGSSGQTPNGPSHSVQDDCNRTQVGSYC